MTSPNHYIDNKAFYRAIVEYHEQCKLAEEQGKPKPRLPDYIGECFMKIATRLSLSPSFINYTFREEMILDAIENCVVYFHNFDPVKYQNPFAYFTQFAFNAFIRRIERERKQVYIRHVSMQQMQIADELFTPSEDGSSPHVELGIEMDHPYMTSVVEKFEATMAERRNRRKKAKSPDTTTPNT